MEYCSTWTGSVVTDSKSGERNNEKVKSITSSESEQQQQQRDTKLVIPKLGVFFVLSFIRRTSFRYKASTINIYCSTRFALYFFEISVPAPSPAVLLILRAVRPFLISTTKILFPTSLLYYQQFSVPLLLLQHDYQGK